MWKKIMGSMPIINTRNRKSGAPTIIILGQTVLNSDIKKIQIQTSEGLVLLSSLTNTQTGINQLISHIKTLLNTNDEDIATRCLKTILKSINPENDSLIIDASNITDYSIQSVSDILKTNYGLTEKDIQYFSQMQKPLEDVLQELTKLSCPITTPN
ncbi:MAG: hypothetical protein ABIH39_00685, partial [Candidatus Margulisiibacteriota bacterium]